MPLDYTYRIELPHQPGQLARVAGTIAEGHGLIGDVVTINVGREASVREITVEMKDREVAEHLSGMLNDLDGVKVLWAQDRALLRHEVGSSPSRPRGRSGRCKTCATCTRRAWRAPARR
jgi:ACT domain-containing protein